MIHCFPWADGHFFSLLPPCPPKTIFSGVFGRPLTYCALESRANQFSPSYVCTPFVPWVFFLPFFEKASRRYFTLRQVGRICPSPLFTRATSFLPLRRFFFFSLRRCEQGFLCAVVQLTFFPISFWFFSPPEGENSSGLAYVNSPRQDRTGNLNLQ